MADVSWHEARGIAGRAAGPLDTQQVPLTDAVERVLAQPVRALVDLPGFDTSAMDGWAVCGAGPWQIVAVVLAGQAPDRALRPGQAAVIATGAAVPDGATAVIRSEDGEVAEGVLGAAAPEPGSHIRPCGEECRTDEIIAAAGTVIGPAQAGLLAAAGVDSVMVARVPRVTLLLLGDELLDDGIPDVGRVRDSLGPQIPGWIRRMGGVVTSLVRVADTVPALVEALQQVHDADLIITTGGTAAGPVDCLHAALAQLGAELLVDSVAVRPGHPMVLARAGRPERLQEGGRQTVALVLGLPGNPQSAVVGLMTLGAPVLRTLLGQDDPDPATVTLTGDLKAPQHENRLVLGTASQCCFTAADHLGSAMLRGLASSDGFAVLPHGGAPAGETVEWLPLP